MISFRQIFRRNLVEVRIECAQRLLHHLGLPLRQHQLHRSLHRILVRALG